MMKTIWRLGMAAVLALVISAAPVMAQQKLVPQSEQQIRLSYAPLVKRAAPAVVNIYTKKIVRQRQFGTLFNDPFFQQFFGRGFPFGGQRGQRERIQNSLGSGVIVRPDGLIVTNNHVIEGADEITVVLADRREMKAEIVVVDPKTDLALLRIEADDVRLPFLDLSNSDDLEVGDLVIAIGNPFGVGQTVTSGIVSALARTEIGTADMRFFIQTDAAINPGNSGGALVGMDGRLVGINSAIYSKSGGSMGIGFAIPANMVRAVISGLTEDGKLKRPWLGAWGQEVTQDIASSMGLDRPTGVLISNVYEDGPADQAGLRVSDIVLSVNDHEVNDPEALKFRFATIAIGDSVKLRILRRGKPKELRLKAVAPPEVPPRNLTELDGRQPLSGAQIGNMSPALAEELGIENLETGVIVMRVRRGSVAARYGFEPGDYIRELNGKKIALVRDLTALLSKRLDGWRMIVQRGNRRLTLNVE